MVQFQVKNSDYKKTVEQNFAKQGFMRYLGAILVSVEPGKVSIELPVTRDVTQQHGFVHAGALTTIADTACGYAAFSLMPPHSEVLTIEYKMNLLSPVRGVKVIAQGRVIKPGRTVTVCQGDVFSVAEEGQQKLCATMLATMIQKESQDLEPPAKS